MELRPPHAYALSDLVLANTPDYTCLAAENESEGNCRFTTQLAQVLANTALESTSHQGSFLTIYQPRSADGVDIPVAIKIFDKRSEWYKLGCQKNRIHPQAVILQKVLADKSFFNLSYLPQTPPLDSLSADEQNFLSVATDHKLCEKMYAPYVLPSAFVGYKSNVESIDHLGLDLSHPMFINVLNRYKLEGRVTPDLKYKSIIPGDLVYTSVQEFREGLTTVFSRPLKDLPSEVRTQLRDLFCKIWHAHDTYHIAPETNFYRPDSGNLCYDKEGRLLMLDTNHLQHNCITGFDILKYREYMGLLR